MEWHEWQSLSTWARHVDELDWTRLHLSLLFSSNFSSVNGFMARNSLHAVYSYQATGTLAEQRNVK